MGRMAKRELDPQYDISIQQVITEYGVDPRDYPVEMRCELGEADMRSAVVTLTFSISPLDLLAAERFHSKADVDKIVDTIIGGMTGMTKKARVEHEKRAKAQYGA